MPLTKGLAELAIGSRSTASERCTLLHRIWLGAGFAALSVTIDAKDMRFIPMLKLAVKPCLPGQSCVQMGEAREERQPIWAGPPIH